jgi:WD40 repeat protein
MAPRNYGGVLDMACDGKTVITACNDGNLRTYDLASKTLLHTLADHKGPVHTVQLSGNKAVSGGSDNSLKVWDLKKGKRLYTLLGGSLQQRSNNPTHPTKPGCSHLEFDDSRIVASFASLVRVYDFETYKPNN